MLINEKKYACATCIKGHRVSSCTHTDRPLFEVKKKGRPATQCQFCREKRKGGGGSGSVHSKVGFFCPEWVLFPLLRLKLRLKSWSGEQGITTDVRCWPTLFCPIARHSHSRSHTPNARSESKCPDLHSARAAT